ncbi:hypothetical protein NI35_1241 [Salmonella enterica subsp. enterica serovar Cerro]|nr:hypothetical protein GW13_PRO2224 [Salmonella enterica subsp. enterica serovar Cerro]EHC46770.1 hypothetical protein LTSEHVI_4276 [Salmonella enterica subsp. enterica serovar Hvittingfoss str. A4-620]KMN27020.1 hypothetical protein NI35_1241 [Salmonella enterica subsp. enterica serovar Cerro]
MQVIWMLIFRSDVISALIYLSLVVKIALDRNLRLILNICTIFTSSRALFSL